MPVWLLPVWSWLHKVWAWLKKYWMWVVFPVGVLWVLLKVFKRPSKVVAPEALGAARAQFKARDEAEAQIAEAAQERDEELSELAEKRDDAVEELVEGQKERVEELQKDPEELNSFLKDVGKDMRK